MKDVVKLVEQMEQMSHEVVATVKKATNLITAHLTVTTCNVT